MIRFVASAMKQFGTYRSKGTRPNFHSPQCSACLKKNKKKNFCVPLFFHLLVKEKENQSLNVNKVNIFF